MGRGESNPLRWGPSRLAVLVSTSTKLVAITIRPRSTPAFAWDETPCPPDLGHRTSTRTSELMTPRKTRGRGTEICSKAKVEAANAPQPRSQLKSQLARKESQA